VDLKMKIAKKINVKLKITPKEEFIQKFLVIFLKMTHINKIKKGRE
jgi:hypothetical protein